MSVCCHKPSGMKITMTSKEVQAMVTKLLSRAEMLSNPQALDAVKAEANGLIKAGTWSLDSVREKEDVAPRPSAPECPVHFGNS